jgi:hypothetical protein
MKVLGILTALGIYTLHCMAFLPLIAGIVRVSLPGPLSAENAGAAG